MIEPSFTYNAIVESVYDADTIRCSLDLGCGVWLRNEPIRFYGINAPEVRGEEREKGIEARDYLRSFLLIGDDQRVVIQTFKDKKGKYGRYIGIVWLVDPSVNVNELLVEKGYAKRAEY